MQSRPAREQAPLRFHALRALVYNLAHRFMPAMRRRALDMQAARADGFFNVAGRVRLRLLQKS